MSTRDLGASVRQRLLNQAKAQSRPFQEVMQYYAMERFLYRLARSSHANEFILKGALLLSAWRSPLSQVSVMTDDVIEGRISDGRFRRAVTSLLGARLAGTVLAQLLLLPSAIMITRIAEAI